MLVLGSIRPVLAEEERRIYSLTLELNMVDSECGVTCSVDSCSNSTDAAFFSIHSFCWIFGLVFLTTPFLFPLLGRVKLARHCRSGKLAAVKILDLHPTISSRASGLTNAGDKADKMILTAEREIAVMKVRWPLTLSSLPTTRVNMASHCIH